MEADVERMTVGRLVRWVSFPWFTDAVHLALTREAVWSAYHTEVRRWPLAEVERVEPRRPDSQDRPRPSRPQSHRDAEANIASSAAAFHPVPLMAWHSGLSVWRSALGAGRAHRDRRAVS